MSNQPRTYIDLPSHSKHSIIGSRTPHIDLSFASSEDLFIQRLWPGSPRAAKDHLLALSSKESKKRSICFLSRLNGDCMRAGPLLKRIEDCVLLHVEDDDIVAYIFQTALLETGLSVNVFRVTVREKSAQCFRFGRFSNRLT